MTNILDPRVATETNWLIGIYFILLAITVIFKNFYTAKFNDFLNLFLTDKFIRQSINDRSKLAFFRFLVFIFTLLGISIITYQFWLNKYPYRYSDFILFVRIFTFWTTFIMGKYYLEKIISITLDIEKLLDTSYFFKSSYIGLIVFVLMPIILILSINNIVLMSILYLSIGLVLFANFFSYFKLITEYTNKFFPNFYYFILYICALEIAPLILIVKNIF